MSTTTTQSAHGIVKTVEGWLDSLYSDVKGFFFGHKTSASSSAPGGPATPTLDATLSSTFVELVTATSGHLTSILPSAESSVVPAASAGSVITSTAAQAASATSSLSLPTTTSLQSDAEPSPSSPTATSDASHAPAPAPGHKLSVNMQTMLFAALGAGIVILVYLITPFVIRLLQFTVNGTKLMFRVFAGKGSFKDDSEMGLNSESFSLTENLSGDDQRQGLDKKAKAWILWYMLRHGLTFDEARVRYVVRQFNLNGIGADGQPLDPKYVSYES